MYSNDDFKKDDLSKIKEAASKDIFAELGVEKLSEEEKGELLGRMMNLIESRAILRVSDKLSDTQKAALDKLLDEEDSAKINQFFVDNVPDLEKIFSEEAQKLRQEMIISMSK